MKKIIRLSESELIRLVKKVIKEQESETNDGAYNDFKKHYVEKFKSEISNPSENEDSFVGTWLTITMEQIKDEERLTDEQRLETIELLLNWYMNKAEESFEMTQEQYDDLDDTLFDVVLEYSR